MAGTVDTTQEVEAEQEAAITGKKRIEIELKYEDWGTLFNDAPRAAVQAYVDTHAKEIRKWFFAEGKTQYEGKEWND